MSECWSKRDPNTTNLHFVKVRTVYTSVRNQVHMFRQELNASSISNIIINFQKFKIVVFKYVIEFQISAEVQWMHIRYNCTPTAYAVGSRVLFPPTSICTLCVLYL